MHLRLVGEAVWIKMSNSMDRDKKSYRLSHVSDKLSHADVSTHKSNVTLSPQIQGQNANSN